MNKKKNLNILKFPANIAEAERQEIGRAHV